MKCAIEMNQVVEQVQAIQLAQKMAEEMRIKRAIAMAQENSVAFCETVIAKKLEQVAKAGERFCDIILGLHCWSNDPYRGMNLYGPIERDGDVYADGTPSMRVKDEALSVETIISYLRKHCYEVEIAKDTLPFKTYGSGWQHGVLMRISIPKNTPCMG